MQNHRQSISWRSKNEITRKNNQVPNLEIPGEEIVEC